MSTWLNGLGEAAEASRQQVLPVVGSEAPGDDVITGVDRRAPAPPSRRAGKLDYADPRERSHARFVAAEDMRRGFLDSPGSHADVVGRTGSGKTNTLFWIVDGLISYNENILWIDTGKPAEILPLAFFKPLNVLIPKECKMLISEPSPDFINSLQYSDPAAYEKALTYTPEIREKMRKRIMIRNFNSISDIWDMLEPGKINVVSYQRFIIEPSLFTRVVARLFKDLISRAYNYLLPVPFAVVHDEFQQVAPSTGNELTQYHYKAGAIVQYNIELLRSLRVRFVAGQQNWLKVRPGVRDEFNWYIAKGGADFDYSQQIMRQYNLAHSRLAKNEAIIWKPDKTYNGKTIIPWYADGRWLGEVRYTGRYLEKNKRLTTIEEEEAL